MTEKFIALDHPHRRYNPLTNQWILVSPHLAKGPCQGLGEQPKSASEKCYDCDCFLCANNTRITGDKNPDSKGSYIFQKYFEALTINTLDSKISTNPLSRLESARGLSRVICISPEQSKTLPELPANSLRQIIDTWDEQINELGKEYVWVQAFEKKSAMMDCSQANLHGQVWTNNFLPNEVECKDKLLQAYYQKNKSNLLVDYVNSELADGERTVVETKHWLAVVPYWAAWPFETMLFPKEHVARLSDLSEEMRDDLATAIKNLTTCYDNLFKCSFPYSIGWHYAPFFKETKQETDYWQLHALFYPPLLRSANARKHMVDYEMLPESLRDLTAEQAAEKLRAVSDILL